MLKNIMVHLDLESSCQNRLEAAIALASQLGASLTGLYVYSSQQLEQSGQQLAEVRELFQQQTAENGVAADWLAVDLGFSSTGVVEMIGYYASFTDLLVVSQPTNSDKDEKFTAINSPECLLVSSGRPVLIIPSSGYSAPIGERILVAWKAGPRASRALHDAMPLLRAAKYVNMVSVGKNTFSADESERLSRYLALHEVSAGMELIPPGDLSVGDTLLNQAADDTIDLMVLGVHIVSRRGRLDLGDVGRHLLGQMTVPMLLSN